jgi:hypothetical protein
MADRREYWRRYYRENRERITAQRRAFYAENQAVISERRAAYQRRYWRRVGFLRRLNREVARRLKRFL